MAPKTMTSDASWPAVGNPRPVSPGDPNPEWEMIAEEENENAAASSRDIDNRIVILPSSAARRSLRRCASTPDLMVSDSAHEVIVEDESDSSDGNEGRSSDEDAELVEVEDEGEDASAMAVDELDESLEMLFDKMKNAVEEGEEDEEPVVIGEDNDSTGEEESATLVSIPSMGMSSWTMASSTVTGTTSAWGIKNSPSFKDILAKNIDSADASAAQWGKDKALTEARLRNSHRRHHLRVRTKPKFVVTDGGGSGISTGGKVMKHAHSTGDLTKMLHAVEEGHESTGGRRSPRRLKKQLSVMKEEEDEDADFVIGRGGVGEMRGGGGVDGGVVGETDAMDYYHRKEHGSKSASNKKKERPDEAKRREMSMHKREMQRMKQMTSASRARQSGRNDGGGKKKKIGKRVGGKKERRRL